MVLWRFRSIFAHTALLPQPDVLGYDWADTVEIRRLQLNHGWVRAACTVAGEHEKVPSTLPSTPRFANNSSILSLSGETERAWMQIVAGTNDGHMFVITNVDSEEATEPQAIRCIAAASSRVSSYNWRVLSNSSNHSALYCSIVLCIFFLTLPCFDSWQGAQSPCNLSLFRR